MRRTEQRDATRARILDVATDLFGAQGFDAVTIPQILQDVGLSRGALYHHFPSKEALFEAVLEDVEARLAHSLGQSAARTTDPVAALTVGCAAFLRALRSPEIRQIVLVDAPAVVGWAKWREIDERHSFGLMRTAVAAAANAGRLPEAHVDAVAHMLLAALIELALLVTAEVDPLPTTRATAAMSLMIQRTFGADPMPGGR